MSYRKRTCIRLEFFYSFFLHVNSCFTANSEDIVQKVFQKGRKAREVSHATWTVWCLYDDGAGEAIGVTLLQAEQETRCVTLSTTTLPHLRKTKEHIGSIANEYTLD